MKLLKLFMKICLLGSTGIIGSDLALQLSHLSTVELVSLSSSDLDLYSYLQELETVLREIQPQIIINAVGFTNIDAIANHQNKGFFLNCLLPHILGEFCDRHSIQLIHFSSDNVFDGAKNSYYIEEDQLSPINYYGWTKAHTDLLLLQYFPHHSTIFRISGIYSQNRKNFFTSFLHRLATQKQLEVVNDIIVAPTPSRLVAKLITELINNQKLFSLRGIYHLTPKGSSSWFDFANTIVSALQLSDKSISPVSIESYSTTVKRPRNCLLLSQKLEQETGLVLPHWEDEFREFITADGLQSLIKQYF